MSHVATFKQLVDSIQGVHRELTAQAVKAVNLSLTLRNWLIGFYIAEYQLNGADRAAYGEKLLDNLAAELTGNSNCKRRQLYDYLGLHRAYPTIVRSLSAQFKTLLPPDVNIDSEKVPTASAQLSELSEKLLTRFSYSHLKLLTDINDPTKRSFYETECLRGNWSVRELKRQIGSLYYERSGLSLDKLKLAELAQQNAEPQAVFNIRDPYIFEFLGLKPAEVMSESQLEDQLLGKLQEFLLELGHGFCFEARQKRILIGDEHFLPRSHAPRWNARPARVAGFLTAARLKLGSHAARGNPENIFSEGELNELSVVQNFRTTAADGKACRVDKRSASTAKALNLLDARCLSTLPLSTKRFATIQNFLTVQRKATTKEFSPVRVGWAVKPISRRLRWASLEFSPSYVSSGGQRSISVGWVEQHETQRQGLALPGFIAFNPAYDLENSVVKDSLTTAADGKVRRVDKRSASTFQLEKGGRQ